MANGGIWSACAARWLHDHELTGNIQAGIALFASDGSGVVLKTFPWPSCCAHESNTSYWFLFKLQVWQHLVWCWRLIHVLLFKQNSPYISSGKMSQLVLRLMSQKVLTYTFIWLSTSVVCWLMLCAVRTMLRKYIS